MNLKKFEKIRSEGELGLEKVDPTQTRFTYNT